MMIAQLTGVVTETHSEQVILEVNGVGYGVYVPSEERNKLKENSTTTFYIYEHIQERAH